jgi:hypothetical protein
MLVCGKNCVDAGMRAPKTQAQPYYAWSKKVNNAACRFVLQWPNWTGIFDTEGDQRDTSGNVVAQGSSVSTTFIGAASTSPQQLPLTEGMLNMKDISDDADDADNQSELDCICRLPGPGLTEHGLEVPSPPSLSITTNAEVPMVDGSIVSETSLTVSSHILHIHGANDATPEVSPTEFSPTSESWNSSFDSNAQPRGHKAKRSLSDSYWVTGPS